MNRTFGGRRHALNLCSLYVSLGINAILNLGLIAYLARVLQPEIWGLVLLTQAFGIWVALIPEYGFSLSAGRAIAQSRGAEEIAIIAQSVNASKALLSVLVLPAGAIALFALSGFRADPAFLAGGMLFAVAQGLDPVWFFQGTERQYLYAVLSTMARLIVFGLIVALVRAPDDGWIVMFLHAAGALFIFGIAWVFMIWTLPRRRIHFGDVRAMLRSAWPIFQFRGAQSLTVNSSLVILGIVSPAGVQAFGSAERIIRNCLGLLGPISAAGMPRIARLLGTDPHAARATARLSFAVMTGSGIVIGGLLFVLAAPVVRILLGTNYEFVIPVLRMVSLSLPFAAASSMIGVQWMLPVGLDRQLVRITLVAGLLNVAGCAILGATFGAMGVAITMVAVEALTLVLMLVTLRHAEQAGFW